MGIEFDEVTPEARKGLALLARSALTNDALAVKDLHVPPNYQIEIKGDAEEQEKSFRALRWGVILSIALIYIAMAAQYESLLDPLVMRLRVGTRHAGAHAGRRRQGCERAMMRGSRP